MDTLSHALWGYGLFGISATPPWRCSLAPCRISFPSACSWRYRWSPERGIFMLGPPPMETLPPWLFLTYSIGHSFVISFTVIALVAQRRRDIAFAMLAVAVPYRAGFPVPFPQILRLAHVLADIRFQDRRYSLVALVYLVAVCGRADHSVRLQDSSVPTAEKDRSLGFQPDRVLVHHRGE